MLIKHIMRVAGLEPARYRYHGILSPTRLPISPHPHSIMRCNGWRWIRTTESDANRFTVCPLWPLGNPSIRLRSNRSHYIFIPYNDTMCKYFFKFSGFMSSFISGFKPYFLSYSCAFFAIWLRMNG